MLSKQGLFKRDNTAQSGFSSGKPTSASVPPLTTRPSVASPAAVVPVDTAVAAANAAPAETKDLRQEATKIDQNAGSRLIVGPEVKLKGAEILNCDTLVVEGRVEATMDSRVIQIAADGAFSGKVGIDVAEVFGRFEGELTARSQLIIHATGKVSGKIRYGKIRIEEGGELSGDVAALAPEAPKLHVAADATVNDS